MKLGLTLFILLLLPSFSFAASYPASCPVEARTIIDAVGGCSTIDSGQYSSIYGKCCSLSTTPGSGVPSKQIQKPTPQPDSETSSGSFAILVSILILGGLVYLVIWFVRKRKKKKGPVVQVMFEKKCPYCKSVIPGDATRCSHCQANLRSWLRRHPIWTVVLTLLAVLFIIVIIPLL